MTTDRTGTRHTRVGAVDCGTNSIRLLVADVDPATGTLVDLDRRMQIVRLGQDVDRTGRLDPGALQRTLVAAGEYAAICRGLGVDRIRFVATSATRDAANRADFVAGVQQAMAVTPEVISGQEEAALSFTGATGGLAAAGHHGPFLVADIGGGSTEVVLGTDRPVSTVTASVSVDIGCVRMTERHLRHDPPTPEQVRAATDDIDAVLDRVAAEVPLPQARTAVGLAGSVTTVAAAVLDLPEYDSTRIHGAVLPLSAVRAGCDRLLTMSRHDRALLPYLHRGRIDVIGAGALVLRRLVDRLERDAGITELVVSEHDILDGIALSLGQ